VSDESSVRVLSRTVTFGEADGCRSRFDDFGRFGVVCVAVVAVSVVVVAPVDVAVAFEESAATACFTSSGAA
jgi:hypothetical protein